MNDWEKVLQGLYCCAANCQNGCPYSDISQYCSDVLAKDALELIKKLLKKRDPAHAVRVSDGTTWWYECDACARAIDPKDNYCRFCGRRVKWDE